LWASSFVARSVLPVAAALDDVASEIARQTDDPSDSLGTAWLGLSDRTLLVIDGNSFVDAVDDDGASAGEAEVFED
jgi:hypothetical protein